MKSEIIEQGKALAAMHGDTMTLIDKHAVEFRSIIIEFRKQFGRCPSANDLLWIASEHAGVDLREDEGGVK